MFLSAVSVLVVAQSSLEIPEGLMNNPVVQVIKFKRIRSVGQVALMRKRRRVYRVWWGKPREGDHLEDPGVGGRIILRWIFRKWNVVLWSRSILFRIGAGGRHL